MGWLLLCVFNWAPVYLVYFKGLSNLSLEFMSFAFVFKVWAELSLLVKLKAYVGLIDDVLG